MLQDKKELLGHILYEVKTSIKPRIITLLVDEFRPLAVDYVNLRNMGETKINLSDLLEAFEKMMSENYDSNIILERESVKIGLGDESLLGVHSTDFSQEFDVDDFRWVGPYLNGFRRNHILLDTNAIDSGFLDDLKGDNAINEEEKEYFMERAAFYKGFSKEAKELRDTGKIFVFGGALLLEPDFFFEEGWDLIFSPDYVAQNIESDVNFYGRVSERLESDKIIETILEQVERRVN